MRADRLSPACSPTPGTRCLSIRRRLRWAPALVACALATGCGGGDPSNDSLAALGSLGASERPAANNVAALSHAVGALEAKVAAIEGRQALTAAAAVGTYRLLALNSKITSGPAGMVLASRSGTTNATLALAPNGTFSYSGVDRRSGYRAQIPSCTPVADSTSPAGGHSHSYTRMNCTTNGFITPDRPIRETNTGAGTWRVGPGNTLVIIPSDGAALTVYLVQGGAVGFSVSAQDESDSQSTGSQLEIMAFVKQ